MTGEDERAPLQTVPRRERTDAARNRERILDAAREVLAVAGAEGLTMDAVAARAGVGKGTIFRRFGDRAGLAEALLDESMREFQGQLLRGAPPLGPGAPPAERLEAFFAALVRFMYTHMDVVLAAASTAGHRRSAPYGALLMHLDVLLRQMHPQQPSGVMGRFLLGAVSPHVILEARAAGVDEETAVLTALGLLRGVTDV